MSFYAVHHALPWYALRSFHGFHTELACQANLVIPLMDLSSRTALILVYDVFEEIVTFVNVALYSALLWLRVFHLRAKFSLFG